MLPNFAVWVRKVGEPSIAPVRREKVIGTAGLRISVLLQKSPEGTLDIQGWDTKMPWIEVSSVSINIVGGQMLVVLSDQKGERFSNRMDSGGMFPTFVMMGIGSLPFYPSAFFSIDGIMLYSKHADFSWLNCDQVELRHEI